MFRRLGQNSLFNLSIGVGFVVFGTLLLLSNYGIIPNLDWNKIWPLVLIILGISFVLRSYMPPQPGYWM
ncbi:hypothetical protein HY571_00500 [Candidatus Micrarchaeota archaeon]|nr:hypothetical protein [Candidatus Micrarchaeota archaeon]